MIYLTNINLSKNELQNAVIQPLATAPAGAKAGQIYFNSTSKKIMQYDGTAWKTVGMIVEASDTNGYIKVDGVDLKVYDDAALNEAIEAILDGETIDSFADVEEALGGKVDKVTGKGLSTNDYDNEEKGKVAAAYEHSQEDHAPANAQENVIEIVKVNGSALTPDASKAVDVQVPTDTSDLTNGAGFIDKTVADLVNYYKKTETYTQTEVDALIAAINQFQYVVSNSAATTPDVAKYEGTQGTLAPSAATMYKIYLVPVATTVGNKHTEYITVRSGSEGSYTYAWEKFGDTEIDLSNYLQKNGEAKDLVLSFSQAASRVLPTSTETLAVIIGKIVKYLNDLDDVAFSGSYNDLTDTPDLVQYKTATITAGGTSATVQVTGQIVNVTVVDATTGEQVIANVVIGASSVAVSIAAAYTNNLTITVYYI